MERIYLEVADVELMHALILEHSGGNRGVRDRSALEAAVFRPRTGYYADALEEAAALMESLVLNHPFLDGNKRTAVVAVEVFLSYNGFTLDAEPVPASQFILSSLSRGTFRFTQIKDWLNARVREVKKRQDGR